MKLEQIAIIAAGLAVVFWPQIQAQFEHLRQGAAARMPPPPGGGGGGGRAQWVPMVLALQDQLTAAGQAKAANLAGQLVVEIIGGQSPTPGAKK
jgi:hypothetical protein